MTKQADRVAYKKKLEPRTHLSRLSLLFVAPKTITPSFWWNLEKNWYKPWQFEKKNNTLFWFVFSDKFIWKMKNHEIKS